MIEIHLIQKHFSNDFIIRDVNYVFYPNMVYGLIGANGSGKTTFFRCLSGLEDFEGTITSPYIPLKSFTGYLPSEPEFIPRLTGLEYLQLMTSARQIRNCDIKSYNIFQLPLNKYASNYSTGMKKKLGITGMLVQKNKLHIFDELYEGIDIYSLNILNNLMAFLKSKGSTVIISSHIISALKNVCDVILVLNNGELTHQVDKANFDKLEDFVQTVKITKFEFEL